MCMHACIHTYVRIHLHTYVHTYIHIYIYIHMYICIYLYIYIRIHMLAFCVDIEQPRPEQAIRRQQQQRMPHRWKTSSEGFRVRGLRGSSGFQGSGLGSRA